MPVYMAVGKISVTRSCSYEKEFMVDLSDESGQRGHPESYAIDFLKDGEFLVRIRVNLSHNPPQVTRFLLAMYHKKFNECH